MKIRYKKRRVRTNLVLALVWLGFSIIYLLIDNVESRESSWIKYGWLIISLAYFALYAYQHYYQYAVLVNGVLKVNDPFFGKEINLSDIKKIRYFAGDYIVKGEDKELTISTEIIDPDSLTELVAELEKLEDVEWT